MSMTDIRFPVFRRKTCIYDHCVRALKGHEIWESWTASVGGALNDGMDKVGSREGRERMAWMVSAYCSIASPLPGQRMRNGQNGIAAECFRH